MLSGMLRRLIVPEIRPGPNILPQDQAHHARDVLRLRVGFELELFTAAGDTASGTIVEATPQRVVVSVAQVNAASTDRFELTIASAVPKGARADWMIEKLSELGVAHFVPLITARSVVHPEGKNKLERWRRLAEESAKQSKRTGVMTIDPPAPLTNALDQIAHAAYLSTTADARSPSSILHPPSSSLTVLVGPEGGWSDDEIRLFESRHLTAITMGGTILRVETAAIAAAAVVAALRTEKHHSSSQRSSHSP
jgi:16S rRNA (uracil1498-N3)-methyltransferase